MELVLEEKIKHTRMEIMHYSLLLLFHWQSSSSNEFLIDE